ncbi:hypothetical protein HMPREF9072_02148 [Capnocytophaga sp. oral taxon 324 str. F0483]|nr:hypothetical protein HMPREF9072_02148 [Capnocytophaga sp. oral taxon 324 str. F0483]
MARTFGKVNYQYYWHYLVLLALLGIIGISGIIWHYLALSVLFLTFAPTFSNLLIC